MAVSARRFICKMKGGTQAHLLEADDGVMVVGKGEKFQLWNPSRWQARRDADREKMAAFVRGLTAGEA